MGKFQQCRMCDAAMTKRVDGVFECPECKLKYDSALGEWTQWLPLNKADVSLNDTLDRYMVHDTICTNYKGVDYVYGTDIIEYLNSLCKERCEERLIPTKENGQYDFDAYCEAECPISQIYTALGRFAMLEKNMYLTPNTIKVRAGYDDAIDRIRFLEGQVTSLEEDRKASMEDTYETLVMMGQEQIRLKVEKLKIENENSILKDHVSFLEEEIDALKRTIRIDFVDYTKSKNKLTEEKERMESNYDNIMKLWRSEFAISQKFERMNSRQQQSLRDLEWKRFNQNFIWGFVSVILFVLGIAFGNLFL